MNIRRLFVLLIITTLAVQFYSAKAQWVQSDMPARSKINGYFVDASQVFAATDSGVYRSTNNGTNWTHVNSGIPSNTVVYSVVVSGANIFAGTSGKGVYLSTNNGSNWTASYTAKVAAVSLAASGSNICAGDGFYGKGICLSTNNGTNWTQGGPQKVISVAAIENIFLAGDTGGTIFRSTDNLTWQVVFNYCTRKCSFSTSVTSFVVSGNNIFASIVSFVYISTDNGLNWYRVNDTGIGSEINDLAVSGNNIFAGTFSDGVCLSTNNGKDWAKAIDSGQINYGGGANNNYVRNVAVSGPYILAGTNAAGTWFRPLSEMVGVDRSFSNTLLKRNEIHCQKHNKSNSLITFSLSRSDHVLIEAFDLSGKKIATIIDNMFSTGSYKLLWNIRNISTGNYIVRMKMGLDTYSVNTQIQH